MSNSIYYVLKDAGDGHYALLQGRETVVRVLLEYGFLEGDNATPKLTEKGRVMRDSLGETGLLEQHISELEFRMVRNRR